MEVIATKKFSGKQVSEEGKHRATVFHYEPCGTMTFENYMHIVTGLKKYFFSVKFY